LDAIKTDSKLYLVTGATGFLGERIVKMLLEQGKKVRVFVRREFPDDRVETVMGDLLDHDSIEKAIDGVDVVFHTASFISWNPNSEKKLYEINVDANRFIIETCKKYRVKKLIYTSSIDVVFGGAPIKDGDESLPYPVKFLDYYSYSKSLAEKDIIAANEDNGLLTCSLRTAGIYGPGDRTRLPSIINTLKEGQYMTIGDGSSEFNHVYVDNCAYAHVLAEEKLEKGSKVSGQCYFVTDHKATYFYDFFPAILKPLGYKIPKKKMSYKTAMFLAYISEFIATLPWNKNGKPPLITKYVVASTVLDFSFNHHKATRDFGYKPIVSLEKALEKTIVDLRQRGFANPEKS
jgi:sterol-4alpha-carboxylate 3-dehydrogenase (decarboxylating)